MKIFLYILLGFLIGILNYSLLIFTVKALRKSKKIYISLISYYLRILLLLFLFYIFVRKDIKNLLFILLGFFITKILFILLVRKQKIKV
jgi:F1F0 ATPase subunit 2